MELYLSQLIIRKPLKVGRLADDTSAVIAHMIDALEAQGQRIPTNDIWISATAAQYDLPVLTTDPHFKRIDGLNLILFEA